MKKSRLRQLLGITYLAVGSSAAALEPPTAVSPGGTGGVVSVAARCPTFNWSAVDGARGYELAIFRVPSLESPESIEGLDPVLRQGLPAGAQGWTPSLDRCLEAGGTYAWALRARDRKRLGPWSQASLFRVSPEPSMTEVREAVTLLRRYLRREETDSEAPAAEEPRLAGGSTSVDAGPDGRRLVDRGAPGERRRLRRSAASRPRAFRRGEALRSAISPSPAAPAPTLGSPSLTVDGNVSLGAASNVFKAGMPFLFDDVDENTTLGRGALQNNTVGTGSTAIGWKALHQSYEGKSNTAVGARSLYSNSTGAYNTAVGFISLYANLGGMYNTAVGSALYSNTSGQGNTAVGDRVLGVNQVGSFNSALGNGALYSNTASYNSALGSAALYRNTDGVGNTAVGDTALFYNDLGSYNTGVGTVALHSNVSGSLNIAVGYRAGYDLSAGDNNIFIGNSGVVTESNTIRIGTQGALENNHTKTFIAGISGASGAAFDQDVCVASSGQLGPCGASSARFKEEIAAMGGASEGLLALRAVRFRYRAEVSGEDPRPVSFGLIAEEVAEIYPDLVTYDDQGRPLTVKYRLLSPLLLNELQKQHRLNREQQREIARLRTRIRRMEAAELASASSREGPPP